MTLKKFTNLLVLVSVLIGTFTFPQAEVKATAVEPHDPISLSSGFQETDSYSFSYPNSTNSGLTGPIPENAVVVEVAYGSDDHDYEVRANQGQFYDKSPGVKGVRPPQGGVPQQLVGTTNRQDSYNGVPVFSNVPLPSEDSYLSRWAWSSSGTSGGQGNTNNSPVNVCVHLKYREFDPNTNTFTGAYANKYGEAGNCRARGYTMPSDPTDAPNGSSGGLRGRVTANDGYFITRLNLWRIATDAKSRGGVMFTRQISNSSLGARYDSDNLPSIADQGDATFGRISMENDGSVTWESDQVIAGSLTSNCPNFYGYDPTLAPEQRTPPVDRNVTCEDTKKVTSNNYVLKRIDNETSVSTPGDEFKYEREITITHRWVEYCNLYQGEDNTDTDPGDNGPVIRTIDLPQVNLWDKAKNLLFKKANAQLGQCASWVWHDEVSESPGSAIPTGDVAHFEDVSYTANATGTFNLRFQMFDKTRNLAFGDVVVIPVTVANTADFNFTCGVNQIVPQGVDAHYELSATVPEGYTNNINVTMSGNPSGPAMQTSPVVLSSSNSPLPYTSAATIPTTGLTPDQPYVLTFSATDGTTTKQCQASLTVNEVLLTVDLRFNGSEGPTTPNPPNGTTGTLTWNTENAASCTGSMGPGGTIRSVKGSTPWSGPQPTANLNQGQQSFAIAGMEPATSYTFILTCLPVSGAPVQDPVVVNVAADPVPPVSTADLKCVGNGDSVPQNGPCTITYGGSAVLYWDSTNTNSCTLTPGFGSVATSEVAGVTTGNLTASTTYTLTCQNSGGGAAVSDNTTITVLNPPRSPASVGSSNIENCGVINITWSNNSRGTGPIPTSYRVYRRINEVNDWELVTTDENFPSGEVPYVGTAKYQYVLADDSPLAQDTNFYSVVGVANGIESTPKTNASPSPIAVDPCTPEVDYSDKDIVSVDGKIKVGFEPVPCSGSESDSSTLPKNGLYAVGDIVTFQVNICNDGEAAMTGITYTDTPQHLSGITFMGSSSTYGIDECATQNGSPLSYSVADIPAPTGGTIAESCSITLTGIVTAPVSGSAAIYRFQNRGLITAAGGISKPVQTRAEPFSISGGVPDRTETAPQ